LRAAPDPELTALAGFGFRNLLDVIPLDPSLVAGSHGRIPEDRALWPVAIGDGNVGPAPEDGSPLSSVHDVIRDTLLGGPSS
jgi:hypothetical protein